MEHPITELPMQGINYMISSVLWVHGILCGGTSDGGLGLNKHAGLKKGQVYPQPYVGYS